MKTLIALSTTIAVAFAGVASADASMQSPRKVTGKHERVDRRHSLPFRTGNLVLGAKLIKCPPKAYACGA